MTIKYRITSHGGFLYIRELIGGTVLARVASDKSTRSPDDSDAIVNECAHRFAGRVTSVAHDKDTIDVTCQINPP